MTPNRIAAIAAAVASIGAALIPLLADISVEATVVLCVVVVGLIALAWKYLHGSQQWDALIDAQKEGARFKLDFERQAAEETERLAAEGENALAERKAAMIQTPAGPHRQPGPSKRR